MFSSSMGLKSAINPVDVYETSASYELYVDAPGMGPEDVAVECHEGILTITGERKVATDGKESKGKALRSERSLYSFTRSFVLPENANADGVSACMDKGVLKVVVPKKKPEPKPAPRRIAISKL